MAVSKTEQGLKAARDTEIVKAIGYIRHVAGLMEKEFIEGSSRHVFPYAPNPNKRNNQAQYNGKQLRPEELFEFPAYAPVAVVGRTVIEGVAETIRGVLLGATEDSGLPIKAVYQSLGMSYMPVSHRMLATADNVARTRTRGKNKAAHLDGLLARMIHEGELSETSLEPIEFHVRHKSPLAARYAKTKDTRGAALLVISMDATDTRCAAEREALAAAFGIDPIDPMDRGRSFLRTSDIPLIEFEEGVAQNALTNLVRRIEHTVGKITLGPVVAYDQYRVMEQD